MTDLYLKPHKEQSLERRHPWVFSGAIASVSGASPKEGLVEGDLVDVRSHEGRFLARGHYQIGTIAVRVLTFTEGEAIDRAFYRRRIERALELRRTLRLLDREQTDACRLVFGEGDYLPGLVADLYAGVLVVQLHSVGVFRDRQLIYDAFREALAGRLLAIYDKSEGTLPFKAELGATNGYVWRDTAFDGRPPLCRERGLLFHPDYEKGQKTGFFLDQRDNRALVESLAEGRSVLNLFCYTGGFSLAALRGGAKLVHSVDSSERAVELARDNVGLNFGDDSRHEAFAEDAFHFMERAERQYDLLVVDPPAFAKHIGVLQNALKGYRRLNTRALQLVKPGGLVFTFSCSQVVTRADFRTLLFTAAAAARRDVQIVAQLGQAADHPFDIYHPEGEYLKGLALRVL